MNKLYFIPIFLIVLVSTSCENTNEPSLSNFNLITETGESGYNDFIGTIDLNDWDSQSYKHLTLRKDLWINKAITDTIPVSIKPYFLIRVHNLSQSDLSVKPLISSPFICSVNSFNLGTGQSIDIYLNIDSTLIGQQTILFGTISFSIGNNETISYTLRWRKPTDSIETEVYPVVIGDCLLPAYPNPTFGSVTISFNVKADQDGLLYILDTNNKLVDTLLNENLEEGFYIYRWPDTQEEQDKVSSGIYKVVFKTDSYSKTGDVLINK